MEDGPCRLKVFDVVGLGNALVDALVRMDERELLEEFGYTRGHMTPVSDEQWHVIRSRVEAHGVELQSGGSCANTIVALGLMRLNRVIADKLAAMNWANYMRIASRCLWRSCLALDRAHRTGKCLSIVSAADAEHHAVGSGAPFTWMALNSNSKLNAKVLHLTGYLLLGSQW